MNIKYKNNTEKLLYLAIPALFSIIGLAIGSLLLAVIGLLLTVSISSIVLQYVIGYYRKKTVITIENKTLKIRTNGKYDIPLNDITNLRQMQNRKGITKQLIITYNKNQQQKKVTLVDLYDRPLDSILKTLKKYPKKRV